MRLLVVGKDAAAVQPESATAKRQAAYYAGWEVEIAAYSPGKSAEALLAPGIRAHAAGGQGNWRAFFAWLSLAIRLARKHKPELITCQDPLESGLVAYCAALVSGSRLHVQDHNGFFARRSFGWKETLLRPFSLFLIRRASGVRTVSARGLAGIRPRILSSTTAAAVPVASDLSRFLAAKRTPEAKHAVCVSRLSAEKGLNILLKAAAELVKRVPDFKLTIVGEGSERAALENLRSELGLQSVVDFVGQADPLPFYEKAEIYVQPSLLEGWGITVTEAAAVGLPIVMTDVGCAGEVIKHEESGLVVPPANPAALAQAMERLLADEALRSRLGEAAQASARDLPNFEARRSAVRESLISAAGAERPSFGLGWILIAAIGIRLLVWLVILLSKGTEGLMLADSSHYITLAQSLLDGEGFSINGEPFTYRTFGYPILVAFGLAILRSVPAILFVQASMGALIALQTYWLARELGARARVARLAAWIVAFEPHLVYYSVPLVTEVPLTILFLAALTNGLRAIRLRSVALSAWSGLLAGLSLVVKPLLQLFPLFLVAGATVAWIRLPGRRTVIWRSVLVWLFAIALGAFPSLAWYKIHFGKWAFSNQAQIASAQYLAPTIISMRDGIAYQEAERRVNLELVERYGPATLTGKDLGAAYSAYAKEVILANPIVLLKSAMISVITYWTSHNYGYIPYRYKLIPDIDRSVLPPTHLLAQGKYGEFVGSAAKIFLQPYYFLGAVGRLIWAFISLAFFVSVIRSIIKDRENRVAHILILGLAGYFSATVLANGLGIEGRLRYHLMPVMFVYVALLIGHWRKSRV